VPIRAELTESRGTCAALMPGYASYHGQKERIFTIGNATKLNYANFGIEDTVRKKGGSRAPGFRSANLTGSLALPVRQ